MTADSQTENHQSEAALFELGRVLVTPGVQDLDILIEPYLGLHQTGQWGDVGEEDWEENNLSVEMGFRIFSVYHTPDGVKFWIITERDRSVTTVLLPQEY